MKADELMIGDWVYYIHTEDGIAPYKEVICIKAEDLCRDACIIETHYEPIPLTPEILEKNGFERREDLVESENSGLPFIYSDEDLGIDICVVWRDSFDNGLRDENEQRWSEFWKLDINALGDYSRVSKKLHVHKLQHALRLCGIDKGIVL